MKTKIVAFSDTHGDYEGLERILCAQPDAELYIHLGDGYAQAMRLRAEHPLIALLAVCGNCDYAAPDALVKQCSLAGKTIFFTHGHRFGVKQGLEMLRQEAARRSADIVLFGHTHLPCCEWMDGRLFLNPGSAVTANGWRYALIELEDTGEVRPSLRTI